MWPMLLLNNLMRAGNFLGGQRQQPPPPQPTLADIPGYNGQPIEPMTPAQYQTYQGQVQQALNPQPRRTTFSPFTMPAPINALTNNMATLSNPITNRMPSAGANFLQPSGNMLQNNTTQNTNNNNKGGFNLNGSGATGDIMRMLSPVIGGNGIFGGR